MNDVLETIMSFINENTTTLIIICIFLIVVLLIYLVETSIRSKRIEKRKEIENIKTKELIEQHNLSKENNDIDQKFEDAIINENAEINSDDNVQGSIFEEKTEPYNEVIVTGFENENISNNSKEEKKVDVLYKNDKKLSEILFGEIERQTEDELDKQVVNNDEKIEELNSSEELEQIMKKLNDINSEKIWTGLLNLFLLNMYYN